MPEHEARVWAVYDHETEEPRATGHVPDMIELIPASAFMEQ